MNEGICPQSLDKKTFEGTLHLWDSLRYFRHSGSMPCESPPKGQVKLVLLGTVGRSLNLDAPALVY